MANEGVRIHEFVAAGFTLEHTILEVWLCEKNKLLFGEALVVWIFSHAAKHNLNSINCKKDPLISKILRV